MERLLGVLKDFASFPAVLMLFLVALGFALTCWVYEVLLKGEISR